MVGKREKYDSMKPSHWWQEMSYVDVMEHAKKCDIAILPIGSIEMHGPHCPTGHDTFQLFPMLDAVAEQTDAMLLPPLWFGAHPHHHWGFPGTVPLQNSTLAEVLKDIVRGVKVAGYNKVIFFFGHGQAFVTNYVVQDLGREGYYVLSVMFQNMVRDVHNDIFETPFWHADEAETSIAMYAFGDLVDMSRLFYKDGTPITNCSSKEILLDRKFVTAPTELNSSKPMRFDEGTVSAPEWTNLDCGVVGDASLATWEKGKKYVDVIVERLVDLVNSVKEQYPAGVVPVTTVEPTNFLVPVERPGF